MSTRMLSRTVTFRRPFVLEGFERIEPAGVYTVDTEEESLDDVSFPVWKRLATVIHITHGAETQYLRIDPEDLSKAEERDGQADEPEGAAQTRLEANRGRDGARLARRKNTERTAMSSDFALSRIYAEGWKAAGKLSPADSATLEAKGVAALNPYTEEDARTRWAEGFGGALGQGPK